jgi:hypothetical protein
MDWNAAIEHHRAALTRILAMLVAMARFGGEAAYSADCPTLPRHLHRAVLRLLRPAEAAARRLVIVVARGLVVSPPVRKRETSTPPPPRFAWSPAGASRLSRPSFGPPVNRGGSGAAAVSSLESSFASRLPALPLFDRLPRWRARRPVAGGVPRISVPGIAAPFPVPAPPSPLDPLDATRLALRLAALGRALDDLPRAAHRFALWQARMAAPDPSRNNGDAAGRRVKAPARVRRIRPLRPGRPHGQRPARSRARAHPVHTVLDDVHGLALWVLEPADTS